MIEDGDMNTRSKNKSNNDPALQLASQEKIYPRAVHGLFALWRTTGVLLLLGIYYALPWLQWGDRQAVLLDLPNRQFHVLGLTFWPQDFFYFAVLLIIAAMALFFFTAIAGRIWCGYSCPQTVWTEAFLWIERKIEGDRPHQIKLDKSPWTLRKIRIKFTKHSIWLLFAGYTGFTFVGYFTPIMELRANLVNFDLGAWEWFWIGFYSLATWGNAGFLREQVCLYMCPYARFQSVMFDKDTLVISYDKHRGEPRGSRKKTDDPQSKGLGSCIDCTLCVQVCPTGIDIRDGLQYQCISCSACIDVCNSVMDKMGYARNLIRYATENSEAGNKIQILRPRVLIYAAVLFTAILSLTFAIINRTPLEVDIIRDRSSLYNETNEGMIENVYTLKLINKDVSPHQYTLNVEGITGAKVKIKGDQISIKAGEALELPVRVQVDPYELKKRSTALQFHITAENNADINLIEETRFLGPTGVR